MKKTLIVLALAAMLVFAAAGSAFAAGINHSGQDQIGAVGAADGNPEAISQAAIYEAWNNTTVNNSAETSTSPHGNFTTTTVKCVVCHAVHYAAPGNGTVAAGTQDADTLLRMKASQACVFCHATAGMAVNGRPVYDGLGTAIDEPGETGAATATGHITGTNCSYCHTNVHGSGADHSVASLDGYLLKTMGGTDLQTGSGVPYTDMLSAITAIDHLAVNEGFAAGEALAGTIADYQNVKSETLREQAVGVFCAECHVGAYATGAAGASTSVYGTKLSGHRIAALATDNWNSTGAVSSGLQSNIKVAWSAATNCKSCHAADDIYGNAAFPHSWGGAKMWLLTAANAGATAEDVPGVGTNNYDTTQPQLADGVCLRCHVQSGNAAGVGISY